MIDAFAVHGHFNADNVFYQIFKLFLAGNGFRIFEVFFLVLCQLQVFWFSCFEGHVLIDEGQENEIEYCEYKFTEINNDNIATLNISMDDLDLILKTWTPELEPKADIKTSDEKRPEKKKRKVEEFEQEIDNIQAFSEISDNLNVIFEHDKSVFNALRSIIRILSEEYKINLDQMSQIISIIQNIKNLK